MRSHFHAECILIVAVATLVTVAGCRGSGDAGGALQGSRSADASAEPTATGLIQITAIGHQLLSSAQRVQPGWTTIHFENKGDAPHFFILERLPCVERVGGGCDQKTVADSRAEIVPVFQNIMDGIAKRAPRYPKAGSTLPAWAGNVKYVGGPGLTSPGQVAEVTLDLRPGTYTLECYVKTRDGLFHSADGMIRGLVVTDGPDRGEPPRNTAMVVSVSTNGIALDGPVPGPGVQTFRVEFEDQKQYANYVGHDAHLIRLEGGADRKALDAWMNWATPGGLAEPAPAGVVFLGGTQDMPAGSTAYVTAELRPGAYAWIAEVAAPMQGGFYKEFTVQ